VKEIIPCIRNECIGGRTFRNLHVRCAVNPATAGRVAAKASTEKKKKVVVIGGGPAGHGRSGGQQSTGSRCMKRAIIWEASFGWRPPARREKIAWFGDYLRNQIRRRGKSSPRNNRNPGEDHAEKPDTVILATGASQWFRPAGVESRSMHGLGHPRREK
jgi:hypothetical protein